jgi:hypothetical protein
VRCAVDQTWLLFLNGLPSSVRAVGALAIAVSTFGPMLYLAALVYLWMRGSEDTASRRDGSSWRSWPPDLPSP